MVCFERGTIYRYLFAWSCETIDLTSGSVVVGSVMNRFSRSLNEVKVSCGQ